MAHTSAVAKNLSITFAVAVPIILRKIGLPETEIQKLMKTDSVEHREITIIYFSFPMWLAANNVPLVDIEQKIPEFLQQKSAYLATGPRADSSKSVAAQLDRIARHPVGQAVLVLSHRRELLIGPEWVPHARGSSEVGIVPATRDGQVGRGLPVYDEHGHVLPGSGRGLEDDVIIMFSPEFWGPTGTFEIRFPGDEPDEVLFHELVHAIRTMRGITYFMPVDSGYANEEEYLAVVIANIYISSKNAGARLRGDHNVKALEDPEHFIENVQGVNLHPRALMERFHLNQADFYQRLAGISGIQFNPVRQYDMEINPAKYHSVRASHAAH
jgi:hypothetical protein